MKALNELLKLFPFERLKRASIYIGLLLIVGPPLLFGVYGLASSLDLVQINDVLLSHLEQIFIFEFGIACGVASIAILWNYRKKLDELELSEKVGLFSSFALLYQLCLILVVKIPFLDLVIPMTLAGFLCLFAYIFPFIKSVDEKFGKKEVASITFWGGLAAIIIYVSDSFSFPVINYVFKEHGSHFNYTKPFAVLVYFVDYLVILTAILLLNFLRTYEKKKVPVLRQITTFMALYFFLVFTSVVGMRPYDSLVKFAVAFDFDRFNTCDNFQELPSLSIDNGNSIFYEEKVKGRYEIFTAKCRS